MRSYQAIEPAETANIYRSRLRELELEHVRLEAGKLAGDDVADNVIKDLEDRMDKLEKAAADAEKAPAR